MVIATLPLGLHASVLAQSLTVSTGSSQQVSRTLSFDTSLSLAGTNLFIPGALNSSRVVPVTMVNEAQLTYGDSGGVVVLKGSLADVAEEAPQKMVRHTGGEGLRQIHSAAQGMTSFGFSIAVPAVTGLGGSVSVTSSTSVDLESFSVFP